VLTTVVLAAALAGALALWAAWFALRDRPVVLRQLVAGGAVEVALLAQIVVGIVAAAGGRSPADPWTFWGYVVTAVVLLPVAAVWAMADRTRTSSVVLLVACVAIMAMQARVWQVWAG
jgi:hypothetical protein